MDVGCWKFVLLVSAICGEASAAEITPPSSFVLSNHFTVGSELAYAFSSSLRQHSTVSGERLTYEMVLGGTVRQTVVEIDPVNGTALFGLTGTGTWQMVSAPGGVAGTSRDQTWLASYRLEPTGRIVPRDTRKDDRKQNLVHRTLNQVSENAQIFPAFPTNHLGAGSRWSGPVLLPLPGIRQPGRATATVTEVRIEGGRACCVVRCDIASDKGQSFATYQSSMNRPDIEIKGTSQGVFDVERGVWLSTEVDITAKLTGPSFDGSMDVRGHSSLAAVARLPADAFIDKAAKIRAFESAIARLYDNDVDGAEKSLTEQRNASRDTEWRNGIATTMGLLEVTRKELAADNCAGEHGERPEVRLLADADKAAQEEKWKDAVQKYEKVARDYPSSGEALQALSAAADIYESKLGKKSSAATLRRRIVTIREAMAERRKEAVDAALTLYKQAGAYETAGELKRAAETYEAFLASGTNGIPAPTLVLARYRLAGVHDKLGDRGKAMAAYKAVAASTADDDYSMKLRQKAREKVEEVNVGLK